MIYICVRQTTDWDDERTFREQIHPRFRPAVELWESTFAMPYRIFRLELSRIAALSWSRVGGATVAPLAEVPAGAIVLPTDDDDWFAPAVGETIAAHADGRHDGYFWPSEFLEVPISWRYELNWLRRALLPQHPKWVCTTNNYAVVRGRETAALVMGHVAASRWFLAHPSRVVRLRPCLSIMNRSLASKTSLGVLGSLPSRAALVRKVHRYRRLYRRPLPARLAWCEPYVARMRALMDGLELR